MQDPGAKSSVTQDQPNKPANYEEPHTAYIKVNEFEAKTRNYSPRSDVYKSPWLHGSSYRQKAVMASSRVTKKGATVTPASSLSQTVTSHQTKRRASTPNPSQSVADKLDSLIQLTMGQNPPVPPESATSKTFLSSTEQPTATISNKWSRPSRQPTSMPQKKLAASLKPSPSPRLKADLRVLKSSSAVVRKSPPAQQSTPRLSKKPSVPQPQSSTPSANRSISPQPVPSDVKKSLTLPTQPVPIISTKPPAGDPLISRISPQETSYVKKTYVPAPHRAPPAVSNSQTLAVLTTGKKSHPAPQRKASVNESHHSFPHSSAALGKKLTPPQPAAPPGKQELEAVIQNRIGKRPVSKETSTKRTHSRTNTPTETSNRAFLQSKRSSSAEQLGRDSKSKGLSGAIDNIISPGSYSKTRSESSNTSPSTMQKDQRELLQNGDDIANNNLNMSSTSFNKYINTLQSSDSVVRKVSANQGLSKSNNSDLSSGEKKCGKRQPNRRTVESDSSSVLDDSKVKERYSDRRMGIDKHALSYTPIAASTPRLQSGKRRLVLSSSDTSFLGDSINLILSNTIPSVENSIDKGNSMNNRNDSDNSTHLSNRNVAEGCSLAEDTPRDVSLHDKTVEDNYNIPRKSAKSACHETNGESLLNDVKLGKANEQLSVAAANHNGNVGIPKQKVEACATESQIDIGRQVGEEIAAIHKTETDQKSKSVVKMSRSRRNRKEKVDELFRLDNENVSNYLEEPVNDSNQEPSAKRTDREQIVQSSCQKITTLFSKSQPKNVKNEIEKTKPIEPAPKDHNSAVTEKSMERRKRPRGRPRKSSLLSAIAKDFNNEMTPVVSDIHGLSRSDENCDVSGGPSTEVMTDRTVITENKAKVRKGKSDPVIPASRSYLQNTPVIGSTISIESKSAVRPDTRSRSIAREADVTLESTGDLLDSSLLGLVCQATSEVGDTRSRSIEREADVALESTGDFLNSSVQARVGVDRVTRSRTTVKEEEISGSTHAPSDGYHAAGPKMEQTEKTPGKSRRTRSSKVTNESPRSEAQPSDRRTRGHGNQNPTVTHDVGRRSQSEEKLTSSLSNNHQNVSISNEVEYNVTPQEVMSANVIHEHVRKKGRGRGRGRGRAPKETKFESQDSSINNNTTDCKMPGNLGVEERESPSLDIFVDDTNLNVSTANASDPRIVPPGGKKRPADAVKRGRGRPPKRNKSNAESDHPKQLEPSGNVTAETTTQDSRVRMVNQTGTSENCPTPETKSPHCRIENNRQSPPEITENFPKDKNIDKDDNFSDTVTEATDKSFEPELRRKRKYADNQKTTCKPLQCRKSPEMSVPVPHRDWSISHNKRSKKTEIEDKSNRKSSNIHSGIHPGNVSPVHYSASSEDSSTVAETICTAVASDNGSQSQDNSAVKIVAEMPVYTSPSLNSLSRGKEDKDISAKGLEKMPSGSSQIKNSVDGAVALSESITPQDQRLDDDIVTGNSHKTHDNIAPGNIAVANANTSDTILNNISMTTGSSNQSCVAGKFTLKMRHHRESTKAALEKSQKPHKLVSESTGISDGATTGGEVTKPKVIKRGRPSGQNKKQKLTTTTSTKTPRISTGSCGEVLKFSGIHPGNVSPVHYSASSQESSTVAETTCTAVAGDNGSQSQHNSGEKIVAGMPLYTSPSLNSLSHGITDNYISAKDLKINSASSSGSSQAKNIVDGAFALSESMTAHDQRFNDDLVTENDGKNHDDLTSGDIAVANANTSDAIVNNTSMTKGSSSQTSIAGKARLKTCITGMVNLKPSIAGKVTLKSSKVTLQTCIAGKATLKRRHSREFTKASLDKSQIPHKSTEPTGISNGAATRVEETKPKVIKKRGTPLGQNKNQKAATATSSKTSRVSTVSCKEGLKFSTELADVSTSSCLAAEDPSENLSIVSSQSKLAGEVVEASVNTSCMSNNVKSGVPDVSGGHCEYVKSKRKTKRSGKRKNENLAIARGTDTAESKTDQTRRKSGRQRKSVNFAKMCDFDDDVDEATVEDNGEGFNGEKHKEQCRRSSEHEEMHEEGDGNATTRDVRNGTFKTGGCRRGRANPASGKNYNEVQAVRNDKSQKKKGRRILSHAPQDNNTEYKCVHCNEMCHGRVAIWRHSMIKHHREWADDNMEGKINQEAVIRLFGSIHCLSCDKSYKSIVGFLYHQKICDTVDAFEECKVCGKKLRPMSMYKHMASFHSIQKETNDEEAPMEPAERTQSGRLRRRAAARANKQLKGIVDQIMDGKIEGEESDDSDKDPDVDLAGAEDDDDDDDEDFENDEEDIEEEEDDDESVNSDDFSISPKEKYSSRSRVSSPRTADSAMISTFKDSLDWLDAHRGMNVFPEWKPRKSFWTRLSNTNHEDVLPSMKKSVAFTVRDGRKVLLPKTQLDRFQAKTYAKSAVFHTGGPVWAMDWCPLPGEAGRTSSQYLMIYSHQELDAVSSLSTCSSGTCLLQLWYCPILSTTKLQTPSLKLGIITTWGHVFQMKWCALGAWVDPDKLSQKTGSLPRLGLLAATGTDGSVHVISVPHPDAIAGDDDFPLFKVQDSVTLCPTFSESSPCLCLDWHVQNDMAQIAAGYGNGYICVWDLQSRSPLLRTSASASQLVIRPWLSFQSHLGPVRGVAFNQLCKYRLVSAGQDRYLKYWDLRDPYVPQSSYQRGLMTAVQWSLHWPHAYVCSDDCYMLNHNAAFIVDTGYFGVSNKPLTLHNSTSTGLSCSEWVNTLTSCSTSGDVVGIYLPEMVAVFKHLKGLSRHRFIITTTTVETTEDETKNNIGEAKADLCANCGKPILKAGLKEGIEHGQDTKQSNSLNSATSTGDSSQRSAGIVQTSQPNSSKDKSCSHKTSQSHNSVLTTEKHPNSNSHAESQNANRTSPELSSSPKSINQSDGVMKAAAGYSADHIHSQSTNHECCTNSTSCTQNEFRGHNHDDVCVTDHHHSTLLDKAVECGTTEESCSKQSNPVTEVGNVRCNTEKEKSGTAVVPVCCNDQNCDHISAVITENSKRIISTELHGGTLENITGLTGRDGSVTKTSALESRERSECDSGEMPPDNTSHCGCDAKLRSPAPETFAKYIERCCVTYQDHNTDNLFNGNAKKVLRDAKDLQPDVVDKPPVKSFHRICWNPNLGSHCCLAYGGQVGLVFLRQLSIFDRPQMSKLAKKFQSENSGKPR